MENLRYEYLPKRTVTRRAHVGVVGSGDLEVLLTPSPDAHAKVIIRTSLDGYEHVWKSVLDPTLRRRGETRTERLRRDTRRRDAAPVRSCRSQRRRIHINAHDTFLARHSFIELTARERAQALLDADMFRELIGLFDRLESPWLPMQNIVCQSDDGAVIACGTLDGKPAVIGAIEPAFQGAASAKCRVRRSPPRSKWRWANSKRAARSVLSCSCCSKPAAGACRKPISGWR